MCVCVHVLGTPYLGGLAKRLECLNIEDGMEIERQEVSGEEGSPVGRDYYQGTCGTKELLSEHRPLGDV